MPLLRISVDGVPVAAIPTVGREIVGARIGGSHDDPDYADLSAWGGTYVRGDSVDHRAWVDQRVLVVGQTVEIELLPSGMELGTGVLMGPQGADTPPPGYSHEEEVRKLAAELRQLPRVREKYELRYQSSKTEGIYFETLPDEYGFGLNVLWNDLYPERASVSLYAYTLEAMEQQGTTRDAVRERLDVGQKCRLAFVA